MTSATLTAARFFRRMAHPVPTSYKASAPYDDLLVRYALLQVQERSNQSPLLIMFPVHKYPLPQLIQRLDATLWTAFQRPYCHTLYSADNNLQHLQPLPFTLVRQWVHQSPKGPGPQLSVVSFLEPADHPVSLPANQDWSVYWSTINQRHSTPPAHFWTGTAPLFLSQDAAGVIQWPGPVPKELK